MQRKQAVIKFVIASVFATITMGCTADAKSQSPSESDLEAVRCAAVLTYFHETSKLMKLGNTPAKQALETGAEKALKKFDSLSFEGKDEYFLQGIAEVERDTSTFKRYAYHCMNLDK